MSLLRTSLDVTVKNLWPRKTYGIGNAIVGLWISQYLKCKRNFLECGKKNLLSIFMFFTFKTLGQWPAFWVFDLLKKILIPHNFTRCFKFSWIINSLKNEKKQLMKCKNIPVRISSANFPNSFFIPCNKNVIDNDCRTKSFIFIYYFHWPYSFCIKYIRF